MINRLDRSKAHGNRGEFPELGHQPRMGIRRQSPARLQFAAEVLQFLLGDAAFKISPRIDSGSSVSLEVDDVAIAIFGLGAKKVVEGNFIQSGGRGKG